ncbi:MAG: phospholipase D-like domain-containing protein [Elusimicrobiales bacterium]|nr:phospholipase D-like domain-containing protein [Elusimicrobiales bacterium]
MNKSLKLLIASALAMGAAGRLPAGEFENSLAGFREEALAPAPEPTPLPAGWEALALTEKRPAYDLKRESEILSMKPAALAAATPEDKVEMLRFLIKNSVTTESAYQGISAQDLRERMIVNILATAKDAASFDQMYYRLDPGELYRSVKDRRPLLMLAARYRSSAAPGDWEGLGRYIETVTGAESPRRNLVKFLIDGPSVMAEGGKALRDAKRSIHIEIFQLQADNIGRGLTGILEEKARAGVKVRLLLDVYGSNLDKDPELAKMIASMRDSGVWVITKPLPLLKDHLDHRKVIVIDGKLGFTGGMNIGRHYQVDWHDQQTLIVGPAVKELQKAFSERWYVSGGDLLSEAELFPYLPEEPEGVPAQVVMHTGQRDRNIKAMYLRAICTAQKSIRIANPYFTDKDVIIALSAAAQRGVKVQVVLPRENDQDLVQHASRAAYPLLIKSGVEVYEYKGRMAHEKVAVMDGRWLTFGSSNLDARSLENNDELNMVVTDPGLARDVETRLFDVDLEKSERILHYSPGIMDQAASQGAGFL